MTRKTPRTDAEYAAMADAVERGDYTPVPGSAVISAHLRMGRPTGTTKRGASPIRNVRFPGDMDAQLTSTADAEGITPSELIRTAVGEYLARHQRPA